MRLGRGKQGSDRGRLEPSESPARRGRGDDASLERLHATAGNRAVQDILEPIESELRQPGEELGGVRLHRGPGASRAAEAANARAFTVGDHVVLGDRVPPLSSIEGRRVLAHELVHVLQQSGAPPSRALGLVPPGSRAERQAAAGVAGPGGETGIARIVEKDLTQLSESELWSEYQLAQQYVTQQAPGTDYDAGVAYVREIEAAVRARTPAPTAAPPASTSATGQPEESFADVSSSMSGPEGPPLQSRRTPLQSGDIDRYGAFNTPARSGDPYAGHEVLQNAWLQATGQTGRRGTGAASRGNPSLAVDDATHARIGDAQRQLGLHDPAQVATMTDDEVIAANVRALEMAGVERSQIQVMQREALAHAARLRAGAGTPPPAPPSQSSTPASGEPNMTSATTGEAVVAPTTPEATSTPAVPGPSGTTGATAESGVAGPVADPLATPETPPPVPESAGLGEPTAPAPEAGGIEMVPGSGAAALGVGLGLAYPLFHQGAIERRRDTEGFSPVGPDPQEGFLTRLGRFFLDPTFDDRVPAAGRFNLPVWRNHVRSVAGAKPTGQTLRMTWERERRAEWLGVTHDSIDVEYTRQPDGTYGPGRVLDDDYRDFAPPDINRVLDPNVPDDTIQYMLEDHSDEA